MDKLKYMYYIIGLMLGAFVVYVDLLYKLIFIAAVLVIRFLIIKDHENKKQLTGFFAAGVIIGYIVKLTVFK